MKKLTLLLVFCLAFTFVLSPSSNLVRAQEEEPEYIGEEDAEYIITFAHQAPTTEESSEHLSSLVFMDYVERYSDGRIAFEYYPGSSLGYEREMLEMLEFGEIQFTFNAAGPMAAIFPPAYVFSIPYLFENQAIAWEVLDGEFGDAFTEAFLEETGIRILEWSENGFRVMTNSVRPIETLEDMEGLSLRVMEAPNYIKFAESLGAIPTPTAGGGELYNALEQGVVDGQENPLDQIYTFRLYETQDYVTEPGHLYSVFPLMINNEFYEGLPEDLQQVIREGAQIMKTTLRGVKTQNTMDARRKIKEAGLEFSQLPPEEVERFREASQGPVIEWIEGEIGREWIDKILDAVEEAEENM